MDNAYGKSYKQGHLETVHRLIAQGFEQRRYRPQIYPSLLCQTRYKQQGSAKGNFSLNFKKTQQY